MIKTKPFASQLVSGPDHYGPIVATRNDLTVVGCFNCAYSHLYPLPSPKTVELRYGREDSFYINSDPWFRKEREEHEKGLWDAAYRWQAGLLQKTQKTSRLVDLGTGSGWFVKWWQDNRGSAIGVEPSRTALTYSPVPGQIEKSLAGASKRFSRGTPVHLRASLLLEHLPDPAGYLRECLRLFPSTQAVLVVVPNEFSNIQLRLNRKLQGDSRYWWIAKDHLNYFNPQSLKNMLAQAGLMVVKMEVTFPMELWQKCGIRYIGNDRVGRQVHRLRLRFEQLLGNGSFALYRHLFRQYGIGRELVAVAVPANPESTRRGIEKYRVGDEL
jgi:hypothetical protein